MRRWMLLLGALAACYQPAAPAGAPCGPSGECPSGLACVGGTCEPIGQDAGIDACTAAPRCEGEALVTCTGTTACDHGCAPDASRAHCRALAPSNGLSPVLLEGATADLALDKLDFNADTGRIRRMGVDLRPEGEGIINGIGFTVIDEMGVFTANSFTVPEDEAWDPSSNTNAFVLYAATTIEVAGTIDGSASGDSGGPGGNNGGQSGSNPPCRGRAGKAYATNFGEGGGGGGGATAGGDGAPSNQSTFGAGGTSCSTPSTIPLRGGNGGGAGGIDNTNGSVRGGPGGGGGGAVALVAMQSIRVTGTIGTSGGGGISLSTSDGGGGGGSGGAVLLEAPEVIVDGALTANGGGGAAGNNTDGAEGHLDDDATAAGGTYLGTSGGRGGAGTTAPTNGQNYTDVPVTPTISRGGGGGGAVGTIEIRRRTGTTDGLTSPPATTNDAIIE